MIDFLFSAFIFWAVGYGIINGSSLGGWIGSEYFFFSDYSSHRQASLFLFQLMFCSTAVTIVSGAVAERITFKAYLILTIIMSLFIYPLFAHWVWGGEAIESKGWLARLGFIDFAGASVVHAVGGFFALAAVIILGPRIGQFTTSQRIPNSNLPITTIGVFLIWFGWIGFNGGSTLSLSENVPAIIINTMLAGVSGGLSIILILLLQSKTIDVLQILNGVLTGLVAITASAHIVPAYFALIIGSFGALLYFIAARLLIHYRIDDVVGAFPVHGIGGVWGIIAVAIFGEDISFINQLPIQLLGIVVLITWAFIGGYSLLWGINKFYPLRVTRITELNGLNISEHGTNTVESDLIREMEQQRQSGDFSQPVTVSVHSDIGKISAQYNLVITRLNQAIETAKLANKVKTTFLRSMSHEYRTPLNHIIGFAQILQFREQPLDEEEQENINYIIKSGEQLLGLLDNILEFSDLLSDDKPLDLTSVNLNELIEKNISQCQEMINQKQIQVDNTLAETAPTIFISDASRLDKIIYQLMLNAVLYNRIEGVISIYCELSTTHLKINIEDTGLGISKNNYQGVFEPFNRLDQTGSGLIPGAGVGLSIVQVLLNSMNGSIGFDSTVNKGSVFWFELPLLKADDNL